MDAKQLIEHIGGPAKVMEETGLSKGRISQWSTSGTIPTPWLKYFRQKYPQFDWTSYPGKLVPLKLDRGG
jgi:hypothetical protein